MWHNEASVVAKNVSKDDLPELSSRVCEHMKTNVLADSHPDFSLCQYVRLDSRSPYQLLSGAKDRSSGDHLVLSASKTSLLEG